MNKLYREILVVLARHGIGIANCEFIKREANYEFELYRWHLTK